MELGKGGHLLNVYMTFGTHDFLKKLYEKHKGDKNIHLLDGSGTSSLLLETEGKSIFKSGKRYDMIDASGGFEGATFVVMHHIPVSRQDTDLFRYEAKERTGLIQKQPGNKGVRILKEKKEDIFLIVSIWDSSGDFRRFQSSPDFEQLAIPQANIPQELFTGKSYVKMYSIYREELEEK